MKWIQYFFLLSLSLVCIQCHQDGLSAPSSVTAPNVYIYGSYELVEFSIVTEFDQTLTQADYTQWNGALKLSPLPYYYRCLTTDGEDTIEECILGVNYDDPQTHLSGFFTLPTLGTTQDFEIDGNDIVIQFEGTTDLGIDYVETDRWRKVNDQP